MRPLAQADRLGPSSRFEALVREIPDDVRTCAEHALVALLAIDERIEALLGMRSAYVLEDATLRAWLCGVSATQRHDADTATVALAVLDATDLIFRFTCARKFEIADEALKQTRISGWGLLYVEERDLGTVLGDTALAFRTATDAVVEGHIEIYQELVSLQSGEIDQTTARRIRRLHDAIPLKLLS